MVFRCCMIACKSTGRDKTISFHQFPSFQPFREEWRNFMLKSESKLAETWQPQDRSLICSLHFKSDLFINDGKRRRLKRNAIPTSVCGYKQIETESGEESDGETGTMDAFDDKLIPKKECAMDAYEDHPSPENESFILPDAAPIAFYDQELTENVEILADAAVSTLCKEVATQASTNIDSIKLKNTKKKLKETREKLRKMKKRLSVLQNKNLELTKTLKEKKSYYTTLNVDKITFDANEGSVRARFLLDQMKFYHLKRPRWSNVSIQYSLEQQSS